MRAPALLVAALFLAGCSAKAEPDSVDPSQAAEGGAIAGVVLDEVGLPIDGADIAVLSTQNRSAISAPDGRFRIAGVPPGPHEVAVTKIGFQSAQRRVDVSADGVLELEVVLVPIPAPQEGRTEVIPGHGFVSCSVATWAVTPTLTQACGWDTNNQPVFSFDVDLSAGLVSVVTEMTWTPSTAQTAQEMRLALWRNGGCGTRCNHEGVFEPDVEGPSPLRKVVGNASEPFTQNLDRDRPTRLSAVALVADAGLTENQVVWQQSVDFYISVFYHSAPAQDYSAIPK